MLSLDPQENTMAPGALLNEYHLTRLGTCPPENLIDDDDK